MSLGCVVLAVGDDWRRRTRIGQAARGLADIPLPGIETLGDGGSIQLESDFTSELDALSGDGRTLFRTVLLLLNGSGCVAVLGDGGRRTRDSDAGRNAGRPGSIREAFPPTLAFQGESWPAAVLQPVTVVVQFRCQSAVELLVQDRARGEDTWIRTLDGFAVRERSVPALIGATAELIRSVEEVAGIASVLDR